MFASVARCMIVSTAQTLQESGNTDISNTRSAGFDCLYIANKHTRQGQLYAGCYTFMFEGVARVTCTSMLSGHSLTLKKWFKVKCDTTKRLSPNDFLDRDTFMVTRLNLTLKNLAKVRFDITKRFAAYGFLRVDCTLETSRTNNKQDMAPYVDPPQFDLEETFQGQI